MQGKAGLRSDSISGAALWWRQACFLTHKPVPPGKGDGGTKPQTLGQTCDGIVGPSPWHRAAPEGSPPWANAGPAPHLLLPLLPSKHPHSCCLPLNAGQPLPQSSLLFLLTPPRCPHPSSSSPLLGPRPSSVCGPGSPSCPSSCVQVGRALWLSEET